MSENIEVIGRSSEVNTNMPFIPPASHLKLLITLFSIAAYYTKINKIRSRILQNLGAVDTTAHEYM